MSLNEKLAFLPIGSKFYVNGKLVRRSSNSNYVVLGQTGGGEAKFTDEDVISKSAPVAKTPVKTPIATEPQKPAPQVKRSPT